jgi:hypothetical protein
MNEHAKKLHWEVVDTAGGAPMHFGDAAKGYAILGPQHLKVWAEGKAADLYVRDEHAFTQGGAFLPAVSSNLWKLMVAPVPVGHDRTSYEAGVIEDGGGLLLILSGDYSAQLLNSFMPVLRQMVFDHLQFLKKGRQA